MVVRVSECPNIFAITFAHLPGSTPITHSTNPSSMIRRFARADGMSNSIEMKEGKRLMLIIRNAAGMMVHLQFVVDVEKQVEKMG